MKVKKAGAATKLVVLILLIAVSLSLLTVRAQLQSAKDELSTLQDRINSQLEINAGLAEDIANSGDPDRIADIAREKLDLVAPGERVFAATGK